MLGKIRAKFIFLHVGHIEVLPIGETQQHMLIPGWPCIETPGDSEQPGDIHCSLLFFVCLSIPPLMVPCFHIESSSLLFPFLNLLRFGGTKAQDHHVIKARPLSTQTTLA